MILSYEECQKSPCFLCKHMVTRLRIGEIENPARLDTRCTEESPTFPTAACDQYQPDKLND